jgi:lipopolysaccharide export system protein LptC
VSGQDAARPGRLRAFWLPGALLAAFVAAGAFVLIRATGPGSVTVEPEDVGLPDVRMEGAQLRQFDGDGQLRYALVSSDIRFFQSEGRAELTAPDLTLYEADRTAWQARAERGTLLGLTPGDNREDEVQLRDEVLLQPLEGLERIRLTTSALTLYPDRQYAATDQAVIIDSEVGRTTAARLEGDLQGGLLKLFNSAERPVQTILLPGQFK